MNDVSIYIQGANIFEMKKYLIVGFLLTVVATQAQIKNVSVSLSAGIPVIPSVESGAKFTGIPIAAATGYSYATIGVRMKESFSDRGAIELRSQLNYAVSPKFYLASGLSLHYARFQRNVRILRTDGASELMITTLNPPTSNIMGLPFGQIYTSSVRNPDGSFTINQDLRNLTNSDDLGKTSTLTMQLPVLVGTSFFNDKLHLRTGPVFGYLLASSEITQRYANATLSEYKDTSKESFEEFQAGLAFQTTLMLTKTVGVDIGAQKFFTSIYNEGSAKYNVVSLGLSYSFL
jgi:hypothetical protein